MCNVLHHRSEKHSNSKVNGHKRNLFCTITSIIWVGDSKLFQSPLLGLFRSDSGSISNTIRTRSLKTVPILFYDIPEVFFMIQTRTRFVTRMQEEEDISQLCTFRTFQCLMSSVLIVSFRDLNSLIDFFSFTTWIFYTLAFASYFALRYKEPHAQRPFRVRIVGLLILFICLWNSSLPTGGFHTGCRKNCGTYRRLLTILLLPEALLVESWQSSI